ncbi:MAG: hypothetical protein OHK0046_05890 [Anaerolineae bacterium]
MTDHFQRIYQNQADLYDALVSREDYQGNLLPIIAAIHPLNKAHVVEFGAGTGRLTRLLAPLVKSIHAYDLHAHMLETAHKTLEKTGLTNWRLEVGDNRQMPVPSASADIAIAGWSFGHTTGWYPETWQQEAGLMVNELLRVVKPGGAAIIIETMGTGNKTPKPPNARLAAYYDWLEQQRAFDYSWTRTDYKFESVEEADQLIRFFFGDALADVVVREQVTIVPECTGIWWQEVRP